MIPTATYRFQFTPSFKFQDVQNILDYLHDLGISSIYASPIFKARSGSQHGYDVVNPNVLNPELGSEAEFEKLVKEAKSRNLGWLQDIVPNHMAFDSSNHMLMDILEHGSNSQYFEFFDFTWEHSYSNMKEKILAPFLGEFYATCLEKGDLKLKYEQSGLSIHYYDHRFPIRLNSYLRVFAHNLETLRNEISHSHPDFVKLLGVFYAIKNISTDQIMDERYSQVAFIKTMLWELYSSNETIHTFVDDNITYFNGTPGDAASYNAMDELLSEQFYRLAFWKVGTEEINYRRFFNINELISVRVESERVFLKTHELLKQLVAENKITGLRVDHVDGLYDPTQYLKRLRRNFPDAYLLVEKILDFEKCPEFWPIEGTTGYEFLNKLNGVFCNRENQYKMQKIYERLTKSYQSFPDLVHDKKQLIVGKHMAGDVDNLAQILAQISNQTRYGSDFTLYGLRRALVEVLAWFPVYRTYITRSEFREMDRTIIEDTLTKCKNRMPDFVHEFHFIRKILLMEYNPPLGESDKELWLHFIMRFQQLTGPLMAKGFEDTVLYNYFQFISQNEVGGNPETFGTSHIEFHYFNKNRQAEWPNALSSTATHDTKRGEDTRARINVLSELPEEWANQVRMWRKVNKKHKTRTLDATYPDNNDEYFLYQTLIGTFPAWGKNDETYRERIKQYIIKAVREAKIHTAWLEPDSEYENAFLKFVDRVLDPTRENVFLKEFVPFQHKVAFYGWFNSLSQVLLKMTSPGVPDFYQGNELWDFSLVDPDNRRPVDYDKRKRLLAHLKKRAAKDKKALVQELLKDTEGASKIYIIHQTLQLRNQHPELYEKGAYIPLEVDGMYKNHVIAFARQWQDSWAITVVPRFLTSLIDVGELPTGDIWEDTRIVLPSAVNVTDQFTGASFQSDESFFLSNIFRDFCSGLLVGESAGPAFAE